MWYACTPSVNILTQKNPDEVTLFVGTSQVHFRHHEGKWSALVEGSELKEELYATPRGEELELDVTDGSRVVLGYRNGNLDVVYLEIPESIVHV